MSADGLRRVDLRIDYPENAWLLVPGAEMSVQDWADQCSSSWAKDLGWRRNARKAFERMLGDYAAAFPGGNHDATLFHVRVTDTWPPTITPFTLTIPTDDDRPRQQIIDELADPAVPDLVEAPIVEHVELASRAQLTMITRYRHGVHEDATPDPDTVSASAFAVWPLPPAEYLVLAAATPFIGNLYAARDDVVALVNGISFVPAG